MKIIYRTALQYLYLSLLNDPFLVFGRPEIASSGYLLFVRSKYSRSFWISIVMTPQTQERFPGINIFCRLKKRPGVIRVLLGRPGNFLAAVSGNGPPERFHAGRKQRLHFLPGKQAVKRQNGRRRLSRFRLTRQRQPSIVKKKRPGRKWSD